MSGTRWTPRERERKWPWRDFLTAEEADAVERADAARAEWARLNAARALITNRAIQRAKYAAGAQAHQRRARGPS